MCVTSLFSNPVLQKLSFIGVILARYYATIKTIRFVNAHLNASNKVELANQNAVYKIIAFELYLTFTLIHFLFRGCSCKLFVSNEKGIIFESGEVPT